MWNGVSNSVCLSVWQMPTIDCHSNFTKSIKFVPVSLEKALYFWHKMCRKLPDCSTSIQCFLGNLRTRLPNLAKRSHFLKFLGREPYNLLYISLGCFLKNIRLGMQKCGFLNVPKILWNKNIFKIKNSFKREVSFFMKICVSKSFTIN